MDAFTFKGGTTGLRVTGEAGGLAAMYSLALLLCAAALTHSALAVKGKCLPLPNSQRYPGAQLREPEERELVVIPSPSTPGLGGLTV